MIEKIEQTINKYRLLENGDRVVVALSGGADSCALLFSLLAISETCCLKIIVAHFNHGLRHDQSNEDEVFCKNLARRSGLLFVSEKMRQPAIPRGLSPEDYFRQERYHFLDKVAADNGANKIALGHHLEDQAETVLLNFLRGSGLDGLKGMLPMRENRYIRPLMEVSRQEIINFLKVAGIAYREDSSNNSAVYLRNRIRGELIPFLKERYNPQIERNLVRMAEIIRRDDDFMCGYVNAILASSSIQKKKDEMSFSAQYFRTLHVSLGYRLIKALLEYLAPAGKGFSSSHIQSLVDLAAGSSAGKSVSLPYGLHALKEYDRIFIRSSRIEKVRDYAYPLTIPATVDLKERGIILSLKWGAADEIDFNSSQKTYLDGDKIKEPLIIRNRRRGDWFEPLGTKGTQKIKKLLIDRKIPRSERDRIALIADQESVIWIENMHLNERIKVSSETKKILILEIRSSS
ncbi:MAG: tRNA lysidine(34) synthetase TilS [Deltaproteobacteria bacterium HGW-Deltaproteobacteria-7]|jgi:tRNA(Ile)-lysidine synthase|nr:MAG: tRNA lysidine(34) synthetase TilS [Deltaproteobacteria bacterium HGW-Deltaproteobacteria-7]PKN20653.1 MAG: tRNA lysidine(34) synthetase TilS [Deltaproteobacteria bacterium HGW-Deltaproteobacteria-6]